MSTYPILLSAVVVDASNKTIRVVEGASTTDVNIAEGTYFLRGDGAAGDLALAVKTALDTATGANVYAVAVTFSRDGDAQCATVTISQSGGASFQIQWAASQTTFTPGFLGFAVANTTSSTAAKVSTLTPVGVWASNSPPVESEPGDDEADAYATVANNGRVAGGIVGGPYETWSLIFGLVLAKRAHHAFISADENRAFSKWWARAATGIRFEYHLAAANGETVLDTLTEVGDQWILDEDSAKSIKRVRESPTSSLYGWPLLLRKYI